MIYVVAAVSENGVIGRNGKLPWHISNDFKWFKSMTYGGVVIMGRKTWDSIGRPLPGRLNIVLSRKFTVGHGVITCKTISQALYYAEGQHVYIIGGSEIFNAAFLQCRVDGIILTRVLKRIEGDRYLVLPLKKQLCWKSNIYGSDHLPYRFELYKL
jgi:dihydrofolate reductase